MKCMSHQPTMNSKRIIDGPEKPSRVLAIDPGTRTLGYADFSEAELIDYGLRYFKSCRRIEQLLDEVEVVISRLILEKQPEVIILEKTSFSQITNNVRLTLVSTRIKSVARRLKTKIVEYSPKTIRAIVSNDGLSTKFDVAKIIVSKYPEMRLLIRNQTPSARNLFFNITDAVACGQAYLDRKSRSR